MSLTVCGRRPEASIAPWGSLACHASRALRSRSIADSRSWRLLSTSSPLIWSMIASAKALVETSLRALHQAGEVVGHHSALDDFGVGVGDEVRRLLPADVLEHHDAAEEQGPRIHLVQVGVLGRGAVSGLEDRHVVRHVGAGRDADAPDLRRHRVGQVVAVQVHGREHVELARPQQHELEDDVRDAVLDHDLAGRALAAMAPIEVLLRYRVLGELLAGELVAPVSEGALGVLHDVALVHQAHALALVLDRVTDGLADEAPRAERADRLDREAGVLEEVHAHLVAQESLQLAVLGAAGGELDSRVHVLRVLAEDHHVDLLRLAKRGGHPLVVAHRPHAGVEVELLAQRDVEGTETSSHRGGEGALDRYAQIPQSGQALRRKIVAVVGVGGLLSHEDLAPVHAAATAVGLLDRRVPHPQAGSGDVGADAVAFDVPEDGVVRDREPAVDDGDLLSALGNGYVLVGHGGSPRGGGMAGAL